MARPPFRLYEGGSAPRPAAPPLLPGVDVSSGGSAIGRALGSIGQGFERVADVNVDIQRIEHARAQDDARVQVAQRMAEARREAADLRRQAQESAPDGWRGLTESVAQGWSQLRQRYEGDPSISTPEARQFMSEALSLYEPELLDGAAGDETTARRQWRADGIHQSTDTLSGIINSDPSQYEQIRQQQLELIRGVTDTTDDQRRGFEAYAEEQFALSAVSGLVERDPRAALRALQDPNATGPYAHLTGPQRDAYASRAQSEINRQRSEARAAQSQFTASLRDTLQGQRDLLRQGVMPTDPVDPELVSRYLGPDVAQAYMGDMAGVAAQRALAPMSMGQVAQLASGAQSPENSDLQNMGVAIVSEQANRSLTQRQEDPGGFALRHGLMRTPQEGLVAVIQGAAHSGDWSAVQQAFQNRATDAVDLRRRGVLPRVAPLSSGEASALGQWLQQLPAQARLAFFSQAAASMNGEAYRAMMVQLIPDGGDVTAYAGFRFADNPTVARRLLRGAELLGATSQAQGADRQRTPTISMPSDDWLRERWEAQVGDAYRGMPNAAAPAFEAYRAYYAAASEEAGDLNAGTEHGNRERAAQAAGAASGGLITWAGRRTVMPPGMRASEWEGAVRQGLRQWEFLREADPRDYALTAIGGGRYLVDGLRNPATGRPVEIHVARER